MHCGRGAFGDGGTQWFGGDIGDTWCGLGGDMEGTWWLQWGTGDTWGWGNRALIGAWRGTGGISLLAGTGGDRQ